jgi:hypothetical protein
MSKKNSKTESEGRGETLVVAGLLVLLLVVLGALLYLVFTD